VGIVERSPKFSLGRLFATPGAIKAFHGSNHDLVHLLMRHQSGDWGELDPQDAVENELSLRKGFRILSVYTLPNGAKVWIITEADRSATTILLPSEY
jgi:hypothetical protein